MPFYHLPSPLGARGAGRSFADSEGDDPSRVGGPADPLLDAADQLSTVISFKDNNTGVARALQMAAQRVAKDQQGGTGRDLQNAFREIATMCEAISLPKSIIDTTKMLFKRVDEEKILRNKNETAIIAACIFIACKQGRVPRTFKEIVALTSVSKKVGLSRPSVPICSADRHTRDDAGHCRRVQANRPPVRHLVPSRRRLDRPRLAHLAHLQPPRPLGPAPTRVLPLRLQDGRGRGPGGPEPDHDREFVHPVCDDAVGPAGRPERDFEGRRRAGFDDPDRVPVRFRFPAFCP